MATDAMDPEREAAVAVLLSGHDVSIQVSAK